MTVTPDTRDAYTAALRSALVEHVNESAHTRAQTPARRRALRWFAGGAGFTVALGGATAAAAGLGLLPGSDRVDELADAVVVRATGSRVVDLGAPPAGATHLEVEVTCLTPGHLVFANGASATCDDGDVTGYTLPVDGSGVTTIDASSTLRWEGVFTYSHREATALGVNANGDTYGVLGSDAGEPDLVAVEATNGRSGYVYASELAGYTPTSPDDAAAWMAEHGDEVRIIPVYESDGETVVGEFHQGGATDQP